MSAVLFGSLAAVANAGQALISKELTLRAPARQLIGVLYVGNCLVLLPFAPFVPWVWSQHIVGLHLVSVGLMVVTAICVWDLLDHGAASATTTATAMSPIPAALAAAVVLPAAVSPLQIVAAAVVVAGVLLALSDAFAGLDRVGRTWRILGAEDDEHEVERDHDRSSEQTRDVATGHIAWREQGDAHERGQRGTHDVRLDHTDALVATTPLLVLVVESVRRRSAPPARAVAGAVVVAIGVALVLLG